VRLNCVDPGIGLTVLIFVFIYVMLAAGRSMAKILIITIQVNLCVPLKDSIQYQCLKFHHTFQTPVIPPVATTLSTSRFLSLEQIITDLASTQTYL